VEAPPVAGAPPEALEESVLLDEQAPPGIASAKTIR
jgi:hypothetical protein